MTTINAKFLVHCIRQIILIEDLQQFVNSKEEYEKLEDDLNRYKFYLKIYNT